MLQPPLKRRVTQYATHAITVAVVHLAGGQGPSPSFPVVMRRFISFSERVLYLEEVLSESLNSHILTSRERNKLPHPPRMVHSLDVISDDREQVLVWNGMPGCPVPRRCTVGDDIMGPVGLSGSTDRPTRSLSLAWHS